MKEETLEEFCDRAEKTLDLLEELHRLLDLHAMGRISEQELERKGNLIKRRIDNLKA